MIRPGPAASPGRQASRDFVEMSPPAPTPPRPVRPLLRRGFFYAYVVVAALALAVAVTASPTDLRTGLPTVVGMLVLGWVLWGLHPAEAVPDGSRAGGLTWR